MIYIVYRQNHSYENLSKAIFRGVGEYDIPKIMPTSEKDVNLENYIGFNYAKTCKDPESCGVHFFLDDYQFNRLWNQPDRYLELLKKFKFVCSPDFSTYTDFPKAIQIYNHYRKHWLGAYWQQNDITVIPTISWSDTSSFEWCFEGEPIGGVVAVSSVGTQMNSASKKLFAAGYNEMIDRLHPECILFYGAVPEECSGNIIKLTTFAERFKNNDIGKKGD